MKEFMTHSPEQTEEVGRTLAEDLKGGETLVLRGNLGAGKTRLTKGIAKGLGVSELVTSPTFTIQNVYAGRLKLYHFDMYRIRDPLELEEIGYYEAIDDPGGVCVIEWAENIPGELPRRILLAELSGSGEERRIAVSEADSREVDWNR